MLEPDKANKSEALHHISVAERRAATIDALADVKPVEISRVAVVGAGTMGGGITMTLANAGLPVTLLETEAENLERGLNTVKKNYQRSVDKGRLTQAEMDKRMKLITGTLDVDDLEGVDLVIEAVFEDMNVKKEVFARLDAAVKPAALLATNTSTLDVNEIARSTSRPEQVVGTHFFSPAHIMKLLEVVRADETSDQTLATVLELGKRLGKVPVVVGVCDGFVGNRMLHKYVREAFFLLEEGALPEQVDRVMTEFGMAMGPFAVGDLAGLDVGYRVRQAQAASRDPDERYSSIADKVVELGRLGQKTGAGFYRYEDGNRTPIVDPVITELVVEHSAEVGIERRDISDEEVLKRLLYQLVNEGAKILDEGIAQRAGDIDVVYVYGYGFPAERGGPMFYADTVGLGEVYRDVKNFVTEYGAHWEPAGLLERLAEKGESFN